ncbi:DUF1823 family protein [Chamaesiphon minutus]|uniref:DUF1823 domain-containing protein n=1 Tax=Chamaesiphon minutus (strain ATCC 27169 / PCC 6605) TaxID=1173020 RepID=K9ULD9_CHAP6|nr:DUF1823 family protein [Chamaesiphon minutus]AFY95251.1 protein of unknown function (DUF1823) [Chamaesiphon minutus PCC 6605]
MDNGELAIDYSSLEWTELPPLTTDTIWTIIHESISDLQVNQLLWYYLGYRYDRAENSWDLSRVAPEWGETYPTPPDFIASRPATVKLTRSIPPEHKQLLKEQLGFKGYKFGEFGPRQTRRATAASWLLASMAQRV